MESLPEYIKNRSIAVIGIIRAEWRGGLMILVLHAIDLRTKVFAHRIFCHNPITYALRPRDGNWLEGGPPIEWSDSDARLLSDDLQYIPGSDGDRFDPPRKWQLLSFEHSYVVAERFDIELITEESERQS
jgi:hypothetical protein